MCRVGGDGGGCYAGGASLGGCQGCGVQLEQPPNRAGHQHHNGLCLSSYMYIVHGAV